MKKKKMCVILAAVMLLCTACETNLPFSDDTSSSQTKEVDLQAEIEEVLSKVSYENVEILFDDIQYYEGQQLEIAMIDGYEEEEHRENRELVDLYVNEVFPSLLDMDTINTDLIVDSDSFVSVEGSDATYYKKHYEDILATIDEYENAPQLSYIDEEKYQSLSYVSNWIGGVAISQGVLGSYINSNSAFGADNAIEIEKTYDSRLDDLSDGYLLLDGEKTVAEAKKEMEQYFNEHYPIAGRDNGIDNIIYEISVGKITGTDYYAFTAKRTFSYNGIPFREMSSGNSLAGELGIMAECAMCESNKVDVTLGLINRYTTPEHVRYIEEPIPFQEVMDRVAYYFTGETKFQLLYGGLEYRVFSVKGELQMVPYWCFIAKNPNDDTMIKVYVDMETGETTHCDY